MVLPLWLLACSSGSSGDKLDKAAICNKCASCYAEDPLFQEGFCDPFWNGTTFDAASCARDADPAQLLSTPSAGEIDKMSCTDFDNAI
jgi:hypothetical protein